MVKMWQSKHMIKYESYYLMAAAEAAAVVPENEPTPTAYIDHQILVPTLNTNFAP